MTTSNDIPLAASPLDRAAHRRTDPAWLDAAMLREDVLVFLLQDGKPLIEGGRPEHVAQIGAPPEADPRSLVWLGPEAADLQPQGTRLFLGKDKTGTAIFAIDMPAAFDPRTSLIDGLGGFEDMRAAAATLPAMQANLAATAQYSGLAS